MKKLKRRHWLILAVILFFFSSIIYVVFSYNLKSFNFGIVEDGKIYRSSEPNKDFLREIINVRKIRSIVVLTRKVRSFERKIAEENGVKIYHLPMEVNAYPEKETVNEFLEIVANSDNYPILVHCRVGADRTGLLIAIKRIVIDGWPTEKAIEEMKYYRHVPLFVPKPTEYLRKNYQKSSDAISELSISPLFVR